MRGHSPQPVQAPADHADVPFSTATGMRRRRYRRDVERWRRLIGHDGYLVADLRLLAPEEGGRDRAVQSGYHAQWWRIESAGERWLGSGPLDVTDGPSIKPGATGMVRVHPMDPAPWGEVGPGAVLHLRERVGQTLGLATVRDRVALPDQAPLRLDEDLLRPGEVRLVATGPSMWDRLRWAVARRR